MKRKTVDFTNIDLRVPDNIKGYQNHKGYRFVIRGIYIEHVNQQSRRLLALDTELRTGDSIKIDTYFGWHNGKEWLTFPLMGEFQVKDIISEIEIDEIKLVVQPIRLRFPFLK